jgi:acetyl esterase/lipase
MTTRVQAPPKGTWSIPVRITPTNQVKQGIENELKKVITKLGPGIEKLSIDCNTELDAEWQAVRHTPDDKSSQWTVEEKYAELYNDTQDGPVILYLHGGAYIVCSIDTHRPLTARMAKDSGGRVFAVQYRLAPQHEFPAALVDAVLAYKYLIDPPRGALHKPVDPSKIVIAGDSAGVWSPHSPSSLLLLRGVVFEMS